MIRAEYFMCEPKVLHSARLIRNPEISIILPTHCRGDNGLLKRAINSVLSQTFSSFELIVMDDGSVDSTMDVVADYIRSDDRVIHVRHDINCGLPALRVNEGLLMARGNLCAYQFDDDQWTGTFLATVGGELLKSTGFELAYARCEIMIPQGPVMLGAPFDYSRLMTGNYIANNSVIHYRSIFERLGGYDMHLLMRRLCDWDLWMRWGRQDEFLFVDELVSTVDARRPESIGNTCIADHAAIRAQMAINRDARLRPGALRAYVLDDLEHLKHLGERKLEALWRQQVGPFQARFRRIWPAVRPPKTKRLHVLVSKGAYASTFDITIGNFAESLAEDFAFTFVPLSQTTEDAIGCADILLLHRTTGEPAGKVAEIARRNGKTVIFLMDDDFLSLHEVSEEFAWLAPGGPGRRVLESVIRGADLVITYSPLIQESVQELNPRSIVLESNIAQRWIARAKANMEAPDVDGGRPMRIAFAGGAARREEFAALWPSIVAASRDLGARAEFEFWGFSPEGLSELESPYRCVPFTFSYEQYLSRLTSAGLDVMIAPLFGDTRAKRAKSRIKFLEITAAGAVGIYSDVEPYRDVIDGVNGIKCDNSVEAWKAAISRAVSLTPAERKRILAQAIQTIERDYICETQAPRLAAALELAVLQHVLNRTRSGKPQVAYFCETPHLWPAGNDLLSYATLLQAFQIEPILVLPFDAGAPAQEMQRRATALGIATARLPVSVQSATDHSCPPDETTIEEIQHWLGKERIGLVHSFGFLEAVGEAARRSGIPHVASLGGSALHADSRVLPCDMVHCDRFSETNHWADRLNVPARRIMAHVPDEYFEAGNSPNVGVPRQGALLTMGVSASMEPANGLLQAVEALGLLKRQFEANVQPRLLQLRFLAHDEFDPGCVAACRRLAGEYHVSNLISFGSLADPAGAMACVDAVLCLGHCEPAFQTVLRAMAARRLVIAPLAGGLGEVVSSETGIPLPATSAAAILEVFLSVLRLTVEGWRDKVDVAREMVRNECSTYAVATELFKLYREAAGRRVGAVTGEPEFSVIDADALCSESEPTVLRRLHPSATRVSETFNLQADGSSAIVVECVNATPATVVVMGSTTLATSYGNQNMLSAIVPASLYSEPGRIAVSLLNEFGESNRLDFDVEHS